MNILLRSFMAGLLALALSGCILQSRAPLFGDGDAKMLLADYINPVTYEMSGGAWVKSKDQMTFMAEAGHYVATADKSSLAISFVPISGSWWVVQAVESNKPAAYVLAEAKPGEIVFYPIACKELKASGKYDANLEFVDSDCFVKPGSDIHGLLSQLIATPGEATTKLVAAP